MVLRLYRTKGEKNEYFLRLPSVFNFASLPLNWCTSLQSVTPYSPLHPLSFFPSPCPLFHSSVLFLTLLLLFFFVSFYSNPKSWWRRRHFCASCLESLSLGSCLFISHPSLPHLFHEALPDHSSSSPLLLWSHTSPLILRLIGSGVLSSILNYNILSLFTHR